MLSGEELKALRTECLKESQAVFAQRFGVAQSVVSRWETRGPPKRGPVKIMLEKIVSEVCEAAA